MNNILQSDIMLGKNIFPPDNQAGLPVLSGTLPMPEGWTFRPTDTCNTEILEVLARGRVCYVPELKTWRYYDGKRWADDQQKVEVNKIVTEVLQKLYAMAAASASDSRREILVKWALRSEDIGKRDAMIRGAERVQSLVKLQGEFDRDHYLLNCDNATLDLRTRILHNHSPSDYISKLCPVPYIEDAACPLWIQTLTEALSHDQGVIYFYQKYSGYTLTGDISEQSILFLYGSKGQNGKSTITKAEQNILGDYACKIGIETLLAGKRSPGGPSEDLARLYGIRRATVSEPPENGRWNDALLKDLSGGDSINARHLHTRSFDYDPQCKIVIFGNHKPKLRGSSKALRRRFRVVNFKKRFTTPDKQMPEKLRHEYPGILHWMVEGCMKWQEEGLGEPEAVRFETDKYFLENDTIRQFIDDFYTITGNEKDRILFSDFYNDFIEYSGAKVSRPKFSVVLQDEYDFIVKAGSGNKKEIVGIVKEKTEVNKKDKMDSNNWPMQEEIPF